MGLEILMKCCMLFLFVAAFLMGTGILSALEESPGKRLRHNISLGNVQTEYVK